MTATELIKFVGRKGTLKVDAFSICVKVLDSREQRGTLEHLVEPISGTGTHWVPSWLIHIEPNGMMKSVPTHTHEGERKQ